MKLLDKLLVGFCLTVYGITIQAQIAIPAAGGNATGSGGTVSYTIGQVTYQTFSGTNGSAAQGVQQPFEISVATAVENTEGIMLEYKVYPNPAHGFIKLIINPFDGGYFKYCLFDINGILLQDKEVISEETEISLESLNPAVYFLKILKDNKEVKVFKIVKK
jgi:Secretion system C-terminal sorting domain